MSTRLYPLYKANSPQLRVLLPNFWMKILNDEAEHQPKNVVKFEVSMEMTRNDVKNYLTKIYNVDVVSVRTRIELGKFEKGKATTYVNKEDDMKLAYVTLPKNQTFEFPDVTNEKQTEEEDKKNEEAIKQSAEKHKQFLKQSEERPGLPGWFPV